MPVADPGEFPTSSAAGTRALAQSSAGQCQSPAARLRGASNQGVAGTGISRTSALYAGWTGAGPHELSKHGLCTGLSSRNYFATFVRLARDANETIGAVMRAKGMFAHSVRIGDLLDAVGAQDRALVPAIVVDCQQPREGGDTLIGEIRIVLSKDFR